MIGRSSSTRSKLTEKRRELLVNNVRSACRISVADGAHLDEVPDIIAEGVTAFMRDQGRSVDCHVEIVGSRDA